MAPGRTKAHLGQLQHRVEPNLTLPESGAAAAAGAGARARARAAAGPSRARKPRGWPCTRQHRPAAAGACRASRCAGSRPGMRSPAARKSAALTRSVRPCKLLVHMRSASRALEWLHAAQQVQRLRPNTLWRAPRAAPASASWGARVAAGPQPHTASAAWPPPRKRCAAVGTQEPCHKEPRCCARASHTKQGALTMQCTAPYPRGKPAGWSRTQRAHPC